MALEVLSREPLAAELVICKKVGVDLADPTKYLHMDQCRAIWAGLKATFEALHKWAVEQIREIERSEAESGE